MNNRKYLEDNYKVSKKTLSIAIMSSLLLLSQGCGSSSSSNTSTPEVSNITEDTRADTTEDTSTDINTTESALPTSLDIEVASDETDSIKLFDVNDSSLRYALEGEDKDFFSIDSKTGILTLKEESTEKQEDIVNFKTGNVYTLSIVITSVSGPFTRTIPTVITLGTPSSQNIAPTVSAGADQTVQVFQSASIAGTATDPDGTISSYEWQYNGATLSTRASFFYRPTTVGTHTLTLIVTDDDGTTSSDTVTVTAIVATTSITPSAPPASSTPTATATPFIFTVDTSHGSTPALKLNFEVATNSPYTYNYNVDCDNDGVNEATGETGSYICTYPSIGTYQIAISGSYPAPHLETLKITDINQWGTNSWQDMRAAFQGTSNLTSYTATDSPDLSAVTNLGAMFMFSSFNGDISSWNLINVTDIQSMFLFNTAFNQNIDSWNVSNITRMDSLFAETSAFNQSLNSWQVGNVAVMSAMFANASAFNQSLSNWDTSSVLDMGDMFKDATVFNQDISAWDFSNLSIGDDILVNSAFSTANYDLLLISLDSQNRRPTVNFDTSAKYTNNSPASVARSRIIIGQSAWTLTDGGPL